MVQVPTWSRADLDFFLHGSMGTEIVPEDVLRAFIRIYPDLFPNGSLNHFGLIPDRAFGWPVGFSRRRVPHLGGLASVGINCAACHVGEVRAGGGAPPIRLLGVTSHFDAEAFFGAVLVATFRTADPAHMKRYLASYLEGVDAGGGALLARAWEEQEREILAVLRDDPFGSKNIAPGALHTISADDLRPDRQRLEHGMDLVPWVRATVRLFHNLRAALHVPDQPPDTAPPASGPGRNDAFGLLSAILLGAPQPYAPVKFGLTWNLENRRWVHWDGNTQSPMGRNLLAALGLGAPLAGRRAQLDFRQLERHTDLTERIRPPRYPFEIDPDSARRGAALYETRCASCHEGAEDDRRLYVPEEIGTDPRRARMFTQDQAERFNRFLSAIEAEGYRPGKEPGLRGTQKYWAPSLAGVWARSPYLHNGSVRTMEQLLGRPAARARAFRRGSTVYDAVAMGYADGGSYLFDTARPGNSNAGHDYGTDLSAGHKRDLIEYLKTL